VVAVVGPLPPSAAHAFLRVAQWHTGRGVTDDDFEAANAVFGFERALVAMDDGIIVATALSSPVTLTLPGYAESEAALITACATLPTHRRRGLLRQLLEALLAEARALGEPLAVLGSTDSGIYGRFGFGVAADTTEIVAETRDLEIREPRLVTGAVRLASRADAESLLPTIFERWRPTCAGSVGRSARWWRERLRNVAGPSDPTGGAVCAVTADPRGIPTGYAIYRLGAAPHSSRRAGYELEIEEMVATSDEARRSLWRHCCSVDLVDRVRWRRAPVDEPLRWMVGAPHCVRTEGLSDYLWLRIVDVERAFALRGYAAGSGGIVFEVAQGTGADEIAGRYELEVSGYEGHCRASRASADLSIDSPALATLLMGAASPLVLASAGSVRELRAGAGTELARLLFSPQRLPYCNGSL
jgi:predicted acetyltransferase